MRATLAVLVLALLVPRSARGDQDAEHWPELPKLARAMTGPRSAALAAAHTLVRITRALRDPIVVERLDVEPDRLGETAAACLAMSLDSKMWGDLRALALACAADLGTPVPRSLLRDGEPEVRRAAAVRGAAPDVAARIVDEHDDDIAASAGAALCQRDPRAIPVAGLARMRILAQDPDVDPGASAALRACLAKGAR